METKFCITKTEGHLKVEIQGEAVELMALLATVMSEDPRIKKLVVDSTVAAILESKFDKTTKTESSKEMIEALYGSIYSA